MIVNPRSGRGMPERRWARPRLYDGSHLALGEVSCERVRVLEAAPVERYAIIPIELDGETPGRLPATFEILPGALRMRA